MESLFGVLKTDMCLEGGSTMGCLLEKLGERCDAERRHLFTTDGDISPGVLVLVNDADWVLEGGLGYQPQSGDRIAFVFTLHGG
ncbi:MAG: ubiquitin-related modifier 1 [Amphiamblys sp. WSBS2006]|nr:MAG: ubiquitin-related modifier 1 [Amphiamblys sp. WSBS2006]